MAKKSGCPKSGIRPQVGEITLPVRWDAAPVRQPGGRSTYEPAHPQPVQERRSHLAEAAALRRAAHPAASQLFRSPCRRSRRCSPGGVARCPRPARVGFPLQHRSGLCQGVPGREDHSRGCCSPGSRSGCHQQCGRTSLAGGHRHGPRGRAQAGP